MNPPNLSQISDRPGMLTEGEILVASRTLGPAAAVGARLVASLLDPDLSLSELSRRIGSQPAIAARVLRVANSAFYGFAGTVSTLERAVQVLGLASVKGAAAAACLDRMVPGAGHSAGFDMEKFRLHSLAVASTAAALAHKVAPALADEAFMAGLLHDLGVVVQWRLRPQGLAEFLRSPVLADPAAGAAAREAAELRCTGATHTHCAQVVLQAWQLPAELTQAVLRHHVTDVAAVPDLAGLVACADRLAGEAGFGLQADGPGDDHGREMARHWNLTDAAIESIVAAVSEQVAGLSTAFGD